jgi:hypothetical protein
MRVELIGRDRINRPLEPLLRRSLLDFVAVGLVAVGLVVATCPVFRVLSFGGTDRPNVRGPSAETGLPRDTGKRRMAARGFDRQVARGPDWKAASIPLWFCSGIRPSVELFDSPLASWCSGLGWLAGRSDRIPVLLAPAFALPAKLVALEPSSLKYPPQPDRSATVGSVVASSDPP